MMWFLGLLASLSGAVVVAVTKEAPTEEVARQNDEHHPKPRYDRIDGNIEAMWQLPRGGSPIKGIVFFAHGCQHQGTDFFADIGHDGWAMPECKSSNFGRCLGLPEERELVENARGRGYLALSVSGGSGRKSCWDMNADVERVEVAISHVISVERLAVDTPIFAIGASSGGAFVGALAAQGNLGSRLKCISPQISGIRSGAQVAPTLFVHMPRDRRTAAWVRSSCKDLDRRGVRCEELLAEPRPVDIDLFARGGFSQATAKQAIAALQQGGFIDQKGFLKLDPRGSSWRSARDLRKMLQQDSLVPDESAMAELLNVAWAGHEITSQYANQVLDFCEQAMEPNKQQSQTRDTGTELRL